MSVLGRRGKQTVHKIGFTTKTDGRTDGWKGPAGPTHVAEEVDERVHAGVAHRQPVRAEPDDVDVLEAAKKNHSMSRALSHVHCLKGRGNSLVDLRGNDGEHLVGLEGQPAHGEYHHDEHEHLHRLLLVAQDAVVAPLVLLARHAVPPEVLQGEKDGESWLDGEQYMELFLFLVKRRERETEDSTTFRRL